ncbi:hypothetical protein V2S66_18435 [Streptomyces sp. V4-01]|uniref:Uncharacterized protein n=1 Tax=Actinacidiphila polyblastidii TaxID=3110430 RepID=A0ABU7PFB0_9ACTN|nr:hypothetical protein [Streptomyces sp. V4-01]
MGLAAALVTLSAATAATASGAPTSPGGVTDARLCGQTNFTVNKGNNVVASFTATGSQYVNGGIRYYWSEDDWWLGVLEISGYTFSVVCG